MKVITVIHCIASLLSYDKYKQSEALVEISCWSVGNTDIFLDGNSAFPQNQIMNLELQKAG
jgi:hypothetical protein